MIVDIDEPVSQKFLLSLVENLSGLPFIAGGQLSARHDEPPFLLPEKAVRTFFHEQWPSHYRLNDVDFIVCQSYRIAIDRKKFQVEFLYDSLGSDTLWRLQQLIRWLVKSSALTIGWTYLPAFLFLRQTGGPVLIAGDEGLGKMVALEVLCELGYVFGAGGILIDPDGAGVMHLPVGTAASFLEWESIQSRFGRSGSNIVARYDAEFYPLESCALFFVDTWNEPCDSVELLSEDEVCRRLNKLNRREYEYFSGDQVRALAFSYQERLRLSVRSRTILTGLDRNHATMRDYFAL